MISAIQRVKITDTAAVLQTTSLCGFAPRLFLPQSSPCPTPPIPTTNNTSGERGRHQACSADSAGSQAKGKDEVYCSAPSRLSSLWLRKPCIATCSKPRKHTQTPATHITAAAAAAAHMQGARGSDPRTPCCAYNLWSDVACKKDCLAVDTLRVATTRCRPAGLTQWDGLSGLDRRLQGSLIDSTLAEM